MRPHRHIACIAIGLALAFAAVGCTSTSGNEGEGSGALAPSAELERKRELLFETKGNVTQVIPSARGAAVSASGMAGGSPRLRPTPGAKAANAKGPRGADKERDGVHEADGDEDRDENASSRHLLHHAVRVDDRGHAFVPGNDESDAAPQSVDAVSLEEDQRALEEDSPLETGEIEAEKIALDIDSNRSPEEFANLLRDTSSGIEDSFALCEGSVYMEEWARNFDARWIAENSSRYKKRSALNRALGEARSQEFLKLLFPALGMLDFDYPVVITDDVIKWMQYFQTRGRKAFVTWLRRAEDVVPQMRPVLEANGLPKDLIYLAMIESGFNNRALSIARAAGPWQFMRATGKLYKLTINDYVDERRDPAKATVAAANYLTNLYAMFGDWHLAAAAYNAGEGRVMRALRGAEAQDYFSLSEAGRLPNETRNYVPKLIAAMIISKNPTKFGFDVAEGSRATKTRRVRLEKSVSLAELAGAIEIDRAVLENLNPELRVGITPPPSTTRNGFYELRVPEVAYDRAVASIDTLPEPSRAQRVAAKAHRGETLARFARRNGIALTALEKSNPGLKGAMRLRHGQTVMVPVTLGNGTYEKLANGAGKKSGKRKALARKVRGAKYVAISGPAESGPVSLKAKATGSRKVKSFNERRKGR